MGRATGLLIPSCDGQPVDDADARCAKQASGQWGVIHRRQALESGMTPRTIAMRVMTGRWHEIFPSIYLIGGAPLTEQSRMMAALLWSGDGFLSYRSAGRVWKLDGVDETDEIEISTYKGARISGLRIHRLQADDRPPLRAVRGFIVSGPERTMLDLAAVLPLPLAGRALDDLLRKKLSNLDRLWEGWEEDGGRGRKGTKAMRILLAVRDSRDGLLASRLEAKMLAILKRIRGPRVFPDHNVICAGARYRLDFAYPDLHFAIETHGIRWHLGDERFKRDLVRDRRLKAAGWTVLYFSWDDVHLRPHEIQREIQTFLDERSMLPNVRKVGG